MPLMPLTPSRTEAPPAWSAPPPPRVPPALRVTLALAALLALAVAAGLWQLRRDTLSAESRQLSVLTLALADELERGLQGVELALQATRIDVHDGRVRLDDDGSAAGSEPDPAQSADLWLHNRAALLPLARKLWLVDGQGRPIAASGTAPRPSLESFLPPLADLPDDAAALSLPFQDMTAHDTEVAMALRFVQADGQPGGWVMAALPAEAMRGAFSVAALSPDVRIAVLRDDGARLAGTLVQGEGGSEPRAPGFVASGAFATPVVLSDGSTRLVQRRALSRYPLSLVTSRDLDAALAPWREVAAWAAAGLGGATLLLATLALRITRAERLRLLSQQALQAEQARAAMAFAAAQEGHWDWDAARDQLYLSPRMKELMGHRRDEALPATGLAWLRGCLQPDDAAAFDTAIEAHRGGQSPRLDLSVRVRRRDGGEGGAHPDGWRWIRLRGTAQRAADAVGDSGAGQTPVLRLAGVGFDETEERERALRTAQLEAQVARASQLEALGTLAGGVAHDFNNILAAVMGYAELARDRVAGASAEARQLDQVLQAARRGKALVGRILAFSRGGLPDTRLFAVQPVVQEVLELLQASLPAGVTLEHQLDGEGLALKGDPTRVYEATMNLCTNALQAVQASGRPGTVTLTLQRELLSTERLTTHGRAQPGLHAVLTVADSGVGIAAEVMGRLFEPFFTTRGRNPGADRGTGLGLAVVQAAVEECGGAIDVQSRVGHGSRFALYLPALPTTPQTTPSAADDAAAELPLGRGQTLLVLDDEPTLVELAEELLAGLGYEPVGYRDPAVALQALRDEPGRYDGVITDEAMPGQTGTQFTQALRALHPELPVILVSGYGGPQLAERAEAAGVTRVLAKPLHRAELARALAECLPPDPSAPSVTRRTL